MEQAISSQFDYRQMVGSGPQYDYTKVYPQAGTTQTSVYQGGNDTIFEIPPTKAYNLSKSWFQFTFTLPATNAKFGFVFTDFIPFFRQIQVYTRGGIYLMDHTNFHLHSKMVTKLNKKLQDTLNTFNSAINTANQSYIPCYACNTLAAANIRYDGSACDRAYTEPDYLSCGNLANTAVNLNVTIPFSELYDSILSVDKDIMLNEALLVRFVWSELSNIGFGADASLTPQTNPVALTAPNGFNVQGMEIHLAVEKRFDIIQSLQNKIASPEGFSLLIPYCFTNQISLTGTNQPVSLRVNRQNGITLERIYHSLFVTAAVANSAIYNNNLASTNLDHFYTNVNNTRRMQYDYYPNLNDDFKALRDTLIGSTIQTPNIHNYNWCWLEKFDDGSFGIGDDNIIAGIDLNLGEVKWDFIGSLSVATNLTHQSIVVCKRKLVITSNGLTLMKMKYNKQTIIKTIPISGIIPGDHGRLMVQINLDFVPDLITLKLFSVDGAFHQGTLFTIRTSLISDNNLFSFSSPSIINLEPIKLPQQPKNVKGLELFDQLNANILVCAPKNSGKTVVIKKIIDECTNKQTNVIIFCATVHNDHSWLEIQNDLNKKGISFLAFTSIYDEKVNVLDAFIQSLQVKENGTSKKLILTNDMIRVERKEKLVAPDYLIIFDDLSNELKDPSITKLMKIQRHFSTKIIISTQSWKDTSSHIRKGNLDYVLLFKNIPIETLKIIYEELSLTIPLKLFLDIYSFATKEKYHFLYTSRNGDYRKDFNQQLEIKIVWISNDGACMYTGLSGQHGDGFGDWFKKAYNFVKDNKLVSRGAKALGDAGVPYAGKIGEVADKLGYGHKPRRKRAQRGGTQYGINGGDLLNDFQDIAIGQVDELTITDQLIVENTTNQIVFGDLQVILNVDTSSQSTIIIPTIGEKKIAQVLLTETDQTINGHKTFSESLQVDKIIETNEMKTNTITPQSGGAITIGGNLVASGKTTVNDLQINGKVSINTLQIDNVECDSLTTNTITGDTMNIEPTKSLFLNAPSVIANQLSFVNPIEGYIPTPLNYYEYYSNWVQFKYNISSGSYVYSFNPIHYVRIGKLVTLCVDSSIKIVMNGPANQNSVVYTDVGVVPKRFRLRNLQMVTMSTYQKVYPSLSIQPCRNAVNRVYNIVVTLSCVHKTGSLDQLDHFDQLDYIFLKPGLNEILKERKEIMSSIPTILWKLYKFFVHLFTGTSEIERICHDYELGGHQRMMLIEQSIKLSTKLNDIKRAMSHEFDPQDVAQMIADTKKMNRELLAFESIISNLVSALEPLSRHETLKTTVNTLKDEKYNTENRSHEEKLEKLWDDLCPNVRRSSRHTSEWGEIGFQGKDPATDFRGMGVLGLDNLSYLADSHQQEAHRMLLCANSKYKYPFAITGINITGLLVGLLQKDLLRNYFYYSGYTIDKFNDLYAQVFIQFNDFYQSKKPENVMQFGTIMKEFTEYLKNKLLNATYNPSTNSFEIEWAPL
ncbi:hypothetical protein DFA_00305 [Cavenderia fasciculata]|uniref:ELMO domain-containing protein n=1 Tax=Cavenderia fasciculata TaxID=261658 RepID=F4PY67_CACFS|nr:uncharacterized protein DFA_00305 [Cavenderia fasciculata]EGG19727.1 hypothetical protein DFA_00305 [Cavenderia fasciculata]|eukprot:XP_004358021.1 hypothetical protein DFA_00305 [Cavenderia fasciculata]